MRPNLRVIPSLLLALGLTLVPWDATARPPGTERARASKPEGRPKVVLDELVVPPELAGAPALEQHLRRALKREARQADWGAGRGSTIAYRFVVEELDVREEAGVVRVRCTALGKLPKGKVARSHLAFSGAPSQRRELQKKVLEIVARGVIGRLAELERIRRGGR